MDNNFTDDLNPDAFEHFLNMLGNLRGLPALLRTISFRDHWINRPPEELIRACRDAIDYLADVFQLDLTLLLFIVAGWTNRDAVNDPVLRYARTALMWSEGLPVILKNWYRPPRRHNAGISTRARYDAMLALAQEIVNEKVDNEMHALTPIMYSPPFDISEEKLLFPIEDLIMDVKRTAPTFWSLFQSTSYVPQQARNTLKNPDLSILTAISLASFNCSHHCCKLQKLLGLYFKSCSTSAHGIDTLSSLGISMSLSWIYSGLEAISAASRDKMCRLMDQYPWTAGHDNINVHFKTYQQCLDNSRHFDSGTIATVFIHKAPDAVAPDNRAYREKFAVSSQNPVNVFDLLMLNKRAKHRQRPVFLYFILRYLINSSSFDYSTYVHKDSDVFSCPPPVFQLPTGPEHATEQYMLDAAHIEEASYEGNEACFEEWWRQLGITTIEKMREISTKRVIPWKGDQLTTSRIRGIKRFHSQDLNPWDITKPLLTCLCVA
ncbi:hypothetical protein NM688_g6238 [Phlebia brevispora]|uniref:Uncharacterized protein n=1 Tax=Phlebia brevispora TaxID=194682 RepID=A0ACC1SIA6_9APHY|nr:hypothetical protein NM688_g6238 [Phlebia brevispora]